MNVLKQIGRGLLTALFLLGVVNIFLMLGGCKQDRYCPPGYECPLPDEGTDYCPGCDDEVVEEVLPI